MSLTTCVSERSRRSGVARYTWTIPAWGPVFGVKIAERPLGMPTVDTIVLYSPGRRLAFGVSRSG